MEFVQLKNSLKCMFENSPHAFYVANDLVEVLGGQLGIEEKFVSGEISVNDHWPRRSSAQLPWKLIDWDLRQRNAAAGCRYWHYRKNWVVGNTSYSGYGHTINGGFQFYDGANFPDLPVSYTVMTNPRNAGAKPTTVSGKPKVQKTIRVDPDLWEQVKAAGVNLSQACEAGLRKAITEDKKDACKP